MSDKNNTSSNDDVLEAEILSESIDDKIERGKNYSASKEPKQSAAEEMKQNAKKASSGQSSTRFSLMLEHLKQRLLSGAFALVVIAALIFLFAQQQWMQNRFVNIDQDLQTLDKKIEVAKQQAETAQLGVQGIKTIDYSQQLQEQKTALQDLQEQLQGLADKPSAVSLDQLDALEQKLSQQIAKIPSTNVTVAENGTDTQAIAALKNEFEKQIKLLQATQQKLAAQLEQANTVATTSPAEISLNELKQWAVKINSQWLLQAPIEQVQQQLLAFKQATTLLPQQLGYSLGLLIDQDLSQLQQRQEQLQQTQIPDLAPLRKLVQNLPQPKVEYAGQQQQVSSNETDGVWQGILDKLSALVKIQKREAESVTHVEALMLHEVIQQRLLMEIDRLDYALQVFSVPLLQRSIGSLNQLTQRQAPAIADEMKTELLPFAQLQYMQRKSLLITNIADPAQS